MLGQANRLGILGGLFAHARPPFLYVSSFGDRTESTARWKCLGSGDPPGLQNRWSSLTGDGVFDSHALPPFPLDALTIKRPERFGPDHLRLVQYIVSRYKRGRRRRNRHPIEGVPCFRGPAQRSVSMSHKATEQHRKPCLEELGDFTTT